MALVTFYQIFKVINDTTLEFIYRTKVGDNTFDAGAPLSKGVIVAGIDFFNYIGHSMEVKDEPNDTKVIERIYAAWSNGAQQ